ncbi:MAG: hypothetical protein IJ087_04575 [Eggerthellaceae bacterium]|nr:hypothetical protein [Eggerthellaceae bacterium]
MSEERPKKWVIEVTQEMTTDEACALGKALGQAGYTGKFIAGDQAGLIADGAKWRYEQRKAKGGDA